MGRASPMTKQYMCPCGHVKCRPIIFIGMTI